MTPPPRQLILNIQPEAAPRFENFLAGDNLELLLALHALALGEFRERITYCWGGPGSGRSHLLQATVAEAQARGRPALYVGPGAALPEELPALLAVDDVQRLDAEAQVALFALANQAKDGRGALLAAGDAAPGQLTLRPDLATRLGWGLVFALRPLNEADRSTAMRERAAARGVSLTDEVVRYLLAHARRDLPSLLATVDALDDYSLSLKRPLSVALAREWLQGPGRG